MVVFKVAYMPAFSKEFLYNIREYCNPSMESLDSSSKQYTFEYIVNTFQEEEVKISKKDELLIKTLEKENIEYIEIK